MITVPLPDGRAARFPDGTPEAEIVEAIAAYLDAIAPAPIAVAPEPSPASPPAPASPSQPPGPEYPAAAPAGPPAIVPGFHRFRLGPYVHDDDGTGVGELIAQLPEVAPAGGVCREVLARSRLPASQAVDPPADLFAHNMHAVWSRRYWRP
jgi:hypothetical protein